MYCRIKVLQLDDAAPHHGPDESDEADVMMAADAPPAAAAVDNDHDAAFQLSYGKRGIFSTTRIAE